MDGVAHNLPLLFFGAATAIGAVVCTSLLLSPPAPVAESHVETVPVPRGRDEEETEQH